MSLKLLYFLLLFSHLLMAKQVIMIDPAGDAKQTGRIIADSLERAITVKLAEALKLTLETNKSYQVIITRCPGEVVYPLQNANFSNRLPVTLYVSLHCYRNPQEKLSLTLYQFSYGDMHMKQSNHLVMIPYDKAHMAMQDTTTSYAHQIKQLLCTEKMFQTNGIFTLPFHPLIGIQAPAIGIEMNMLTQNDWHTYLDPLAKSICAALETVT